MEVFNKHSGIVHDGVFNLSQFIFYFFAFVHTLSQQHTVSFFHFTYPSENFFRSMKSPRTLNLVVELPFPELTVFKDIFSYFKFLHHLQTRPNRNHSVSSIKKDEFVNSD